MCSATFPTRCMPRLACVCTHDWGLGGKFSGCPPDPICGTFAFETSSLKGVFLEWSGGGFRLFGGVWTEAVRLRPCFPGGLVFSTKSRIPGWLLELRGSTRLTAFLLVGIGVHLALGLTAIALGQPCLSYRTWRGAKTS